MAKVIWELATDILDSQSVKAISVNKDIKIRFKMSDDSAFSSSSDGVTFNQFMDQGDKSGSAINGLYLSADDFNLSLGFGQGMDSGDWRELMTDFDQNGGYFFQQSTVEFAANNYTIWDDEQLPFRAHYHSSTFNNNIFEPHLEAENTNILQNIEWEVDDYSAILTLPNLKVCFPQVTDSQYVTNIQGITSEYIHCTGTGTSGGPWPGGGNIVNIHQDHQTHTWDDDDYYGPNHKLEKDWFTEFHETWFDHSNGAYVPVDQVLGSCIFLKWSFKLYQNLGGGSVSHKLSRRINSGFTTWQHDSTFQDYDFTEYWTTLRLIDEKDLSVFINNVQTPSVVLSGDTAECSVEISSSDFIGTVFVAAFDKMYLDIFGSEETIEGTPGGTWISEATELFGTLDEDSVADYGIIKFENSDSSFISVNITENETVTLPFTYQSEQAFTNATDRFAIIVKTTNLQSDSYETPQIVTEQYETMSELDKYQYSDNNIIQILDVESDLATQPYPSENIITKPSDVIFNIIGEELGYDQEVDYVSLQNSRSWHTDWKFAFSVFQKINSKKLIQEISQSTKLVPTLSNDKLKFICLQDNYNDSEVTTIDVADIITYNFERTSIDDLVTQVEVKYHYDYGLKRFTKTTGEIKVNVDYLPNTYFLNGDYSQVQQNELENYNYYSLEFDENLNQINHINTYIVHESKYIRDSHTANKLAYSILKERCNQHNIVNITLPIKYYYYELGDIIRFSDLIEGKKIYGEDYVVTDVNNLPIRSGQYILPYFIITEINKTLNDVRIKAYQLHHLSNDRLELNNQTLKQYSEFLEVSDEVTVNMPGDVNQDGLVDVLDIVALVLHVVEPGGPGSLSGQAFLNADINGDGLANVLDVVQMVQMIINEDTVQAVGYDQTKQIIETAEALSARIIITENDVILKANGEIAAIEIDYTGKFNGSNKMPPGWSVVAGKNKILFYSLAKSGVPQDATIMTYVGSLNILSVKYVTWNNKLHYASVTKSAAFSWNSSNNKWGNESQKYETIKPKFYNKVIRKSTI